MSTNEEEMYVTKRNGKTEIVSFDKILKRIKKVGQEANIKINYTSLAMKVIDQLFNNISTTKIDELTSEQCASLSSSHPDYNILAGRVVVSNHHKNTKDSFYQVMKDLYNFKDVHGKSYPLIDSNLYKIICKFGKEKIDSVCDYNRDYLIDFFGFKTLERAYLMKINKKIVERPQHMWLRVAMGIHGDDWDKIVETYEFMSQKYFTHATPTLFNAGTPCPQLSSCYLMAMEDDSIDGIFNTLKDCALISKWAGGIGLHIHNVRASGSHIRGTNGTSNGIVPMLKVFNNTAKYVDQCITPNTYIYTTNGPMEIQNVSSNETYIFNSEGKPEIIHNVLEHSYEGPMLEISDTYSMEPLCVTGEHPIYALQLQEKETNDQVIKDSLNAGISKCEFVDASKITTDDFIVYTIPDYEKDIESITNDDCYMYGILLEDGSLSSRNMNGYIYLHKDLKKNSIVFSEDYLKSKSIQYSVDEEIENCIRLKWNKNIEFPFRYSDLYDITKEKRIANKWLNLPLSKSKYIIKGLLDINKKQKEYIFYNTSRLLVEGLRYLLLRFGILSSGYITNRRISKDHHMSLDCMMKSNKTYVLRIPKTQELCELFNTLEEDKKSTFKFLRHNNLLFSRVKSIEEREYHGTLYDLQMTNVHDYMIHNGVVHNGGGKRNGSFAIYIEPWHSDVEIFLQMRKNHGDEELKARDLFYALWVPDLFMERVQTGKMWTLMCPSECPGLADVYGEDFVELYTKYERENKGRRQIPARDLWFQILDSQMETGTPYLLYKDASNKKSNQKNIGTIKSSNLCVCPETPILTDKGQFPIYSLWAGNYPENDQESHKITNVWNGDEFVPVEIHKTNKNVEFINVKTSDGMTLTCTPYHKFYLRTGLNEPELKEAQELQPGDLLLSCSFPIIDGEETYTDDAKQHGCNAGMKNLNYTSEMKDNIPVPINHSLQNKLDWFSSFIEPYVVSEYTSLPTKYEIHSYNIPFLQDIKLMLQTCGINTVVRMDEISAVFVITQIQLRHLSELGMYFQTISFSLIDIPLLEDERYTIDMIPSIRVVSVNKCDKVDDSYCFNEPQKHMGVFNGILTSQCTEILEYSDDKETAVCNLASIALPAFVCKDEKDVPYFDFEKLHTITKIVTYNLNKVIDVNFYPTPKTKVSNMRHRPIGLGVQGLADVFFKMNMAFSSEDAKTLNKHIFETLYHAALERSNEIALTDGAYETFEGSPASQGFLQFDLWGVDPTNKRYNWDELKDKIKKSGLRNSLLVAPMPTASTSQILGYNECIEPITSNIYSRRTIAGEFILVNKYLMQEMLDKKMWNETLKNHMIANNGSIQHLDYIDDKTKEKYKTVWEIQMKDLVEMAADRGAYICQSQSLNLWLEDPNYNSMTSMHFYSWKKGLKTGIYYLRRRPKHHAQQFTIEPERQDTCEMCSA